jgi:hypothetical protein
MLTAACSAILCGARGYAAIAQWGRLQDIAWMHPLGAMLTAACSAILCGARGYAAIAQWGRLQDIAWMHRLGFRRRPPGQGAYRKLFLKLDLKALEAALAAWAEHLVGAPAQDQALRAVAIDGKTLRGSETPLRGAVHLLAALDQATGGVLAQTAVAPTTNEHKTAFALLEMMVLQGKVITGDAAFCQRDLCQHIVTQEGHYFFKVDDNQPTLKADIALAFEPGFSPLESGRAGGLPRAVHDRGQPRGPHRDPDVGDDQPAAGLSGLAGCGSGLSGGADRADRGGDDP